MKSLFLSHGGPTIVEEQNSYTAFLRDLGKTERPEAIIIFTAHWEEEITTISSIRDNYKTIHDFYGFPERFYKRKYEPLGSPDLAARIGELLLYAGIPYAFDETRGLDHGSWDVLSLMYPSADIPVVQISVNPFSPKEQQEAIGKALQGLKDENILVIGSGSTVHNLATVNFQAKKVEEWAESFDAWLIEAIQSKKRNELYHFQDYAPYARKAVPRDEHLVPLYIAMGAGTLEKAQVLHHSYVYGTLTYLAMQF